MRQAASIGIGWAVLCGLMACSGDNSTSASPCEPACIAPSQCIEETGACSTVSMPEDMGDADTSRERDLTTTPGRCAQHEHVSQGTCTPCQPGTTRPAGDDPASGDTSCEPVLCEEDFHVVASQCVPCTKGSTRPAGDDASLEDTSCVPTLCQADEYVQQNTCIPCPAGTRNEAGDDASLEDTSCEPILCAQDEFVQDHTCTPCAPGTTRLAGDDASGSDTSCEAVLCAENQRVLDHTCTPCSAGLTRSAGDDASGEDTSCTRWQTPLYMSDTHTCAKMQDRTLKCWGRNHVGQLGLGSVEPAEQLTPITVPDLSNVTHASIGANRSCIIVEPGQVKCWGSQYNDTWLGVESSETAISIPSSVRNITNAIHLKIPKHGSSTCAIIDMGQVKCCGDTTSNQIGKLRWPKTIDNISAANILNLGVSTYCALLESGQTACWGSNNGKFANGMLNGSTIAQTSHYPSQVVDFDVGSVHTCALLDTREIWCAGTNSRNQITNKYNDNMIITFPVKIDELEKQQQIIVGFAYNCTRGEDELVKCWGTLPGGLEYGLPQTIQNLTGARDIQGDDTFACALLDTGEVACWGRNDHGQLGGGTRTDSLGTATRVSGITNAVSIHVGPKRACALLDDGKIMCWGYNEYGVLGDGTTQDKLTPILLEL